VLSVAGIVSVVIFLIVGFSCYRNGLFSTLVTLFIVVLSSAAAMLCLGPMPRMMFVSRLGWYAPPLCFFGVFLLGLVILQTIANYLFPPKLTLPKLVDVLGGSILGLVTALFTTGVLMVAFALFPGTGEPEDKVVFLKADAFFVRSMSWLSRWTGSTRLDDDEFLRRVRREKYDYHVRERTEIEIDQENQECFRRLNTLGVALKRYLTDMNGVYPESIDDLYKYVPGRTTDKLWAELTVCPATKMAYRLFPVRNFKAIDGDKNYVLIYDSVGGYLPPPHDADWVGHRGLGEGKRPALTADAPAFRVRWIPETDLRGLLDAQRAAQKSP